MIGSLVYGDFVYDSEEYMDETWGLIPSFPDYFISDMGRVWSSLSNAFLKPYSMNGYHVGVGLRNIDGRTSMYIHQMVAKTFIPNPTNLPLVRHLDDDPHNNIVDNLRWGTQAQNVRDAIENGSFPGVTWVPIRVTTIDDVFVGNFQSQHEAARYFGISVAWISKNADTGRSINGLLFERLL